MVYYKKHTGKPSVDYNSSVEEALCYGWIDSTIKKLDNDKYVRKFTPRNKNSVWSELNKRRVKKLIKEKRMTNIGLSKIKYAKRNGQWDKKYMPAKDLEIPIDFRKALNENNEAKDFFDGLAPSYKKQFIGWISYAKREETKAKRIEESIKILAKKEKLGLK
jgi:uncharacterized protein YdeI (YjbR/CyaY-like superfamily)